MYPPQASFIPVTVALVRFVEVSGFDGLYPYWYLGSTPVRYLAGPVVPGILVGLHKILPNLSLFDLSYLVVLLALVLGAVGWGIFAWQLSNQRKIGVFVGIISLFLPWHWVSALALSEVSAVLAAALTPWALLAFSVQRLASSEKGKKLYAIRYTLVPSLLFGLLLLTNTTAAIPAIVGLMILSISNFKFQISNLKKAAIVLVIGWLLSLSWYQPDFWWTTLLAPSIGGKSAAAAFVSLVNLLRLFVPVIIAFVIVFWGFKPKTVYQKFTLSWLTIFGSLTLFRFMADPDFWMDWTSWTSEVEVGFTLVFALILGRSVHHFEKTFGQTLYKVRNKVRSESSDLTLASRRRQDFGGQAARGVYPELVEGSSFSKWFPSLIRSKLTIYYLPFTVYIFVGWILIWQNRDFWLPRSSIDQTVELRIAQFLKDNVREGETVFLSGTTAFWLDALVDVRQVRGGRDEASVDNNWRDAAWEVREGLNAEKSYEQLKRLGIDYLVVHTKQSGEFYHDFANSLKFENSASLEKIYQEKGDIIYKVR